MKNNQQNLKTDTVMRQALVIGSLVNLAALGLSLAVNINFLALSLLVSGGLLVSGIFGFCPLAFMLSKVPCNRKG